MAKKAEIVLSINTQNAVKNIAAVNEEINGTVKSVDDLRKTAAALEEQLEQQDFGSEKFMELQAALIETNRALKDYELSVESLDTEQVASEFGSFAAGVADTATSAVALSSAMGITDESSMAMIETLASGMAIAQGFRGGIEGIISFQKLLRNSTLVQNALQAKSIAQTGAQTTATVAQTAATGAQTAATGGASVAMGILNAVMAANPVLLLVAGIGALVGALALFSGGTSEAAAAQDVLNASLENTTRSAEDATAALDRLSARQTTVIANEITRLEQQRELLNARSELTEQQEEELANLEEQINDLNVEKLEDLTDTAQKKLNELGFGIEATFDKIKNDIDLTDEEDGVNNIDYSKLIKKNESLRESFEDVFFQGFNEQNIDQQIVNLEKLRNKVTQYQNTLAKKETLLDEAEQEVFADAITDAETLATKLTDMINAADGYTEAIGNAEAFDAEQKHLDLLNQIREQEEAAAEAEKKRKEFIKQQNALREQLIKVRQEIELQGIEDTNERAIQAVEFRLENELRKIKGNSELAVELRTALEEKAQNDIDKIKEAARQKELLAEQKLAQQVAQNKIKAEQDALAKLEAAQEEAFQRSLSDEQREITAVQDKYFELIELAKQFGEDTAALEEEQQSLIDEIQERHRQERLEADKAAMEERVLAVEEAADAVSGVVTAALGGGFEEINMAFDRLNESLFGEEGLFKKMEAGAISAMDAVRIGIETTMEIIGAVFEAQAEAARQQREDRFSQESEALKSSLANREISQKQFDEKQKLIQQKKDQQELAAKRKAFKQQKALAITNAVMTTAQAVIQGAANAFPLNIVMMALAAAVGAAQIGIIASQKFTAARGGVVPSNGVGNPSNVDSVDAMLAPGETVINAQSSAMFPQLLSDINQAGGGIALAPSIPSSGTDVVEDEPTFKENMRETVVKAIVVESDITEAQTRVSRIERNAEF